MMTLLNYSTISKASLYFLNSNLCFLNYVNILLVQMMTAMI